MKEDDKSDKKEIKQSIRKFRKNNTSKINISEISEFKDANCINFTSSSLDGIIFFKKSDEQSVNDKIKAFKKIVPKQKISSEKLKALYDREALEEYIEKLKEEIEVSQKNGEKVSKEFSIIKELFKENLYSELMDTEIEAEKFNLYCEAARILGLSPQQQKYFAAKALGFEKKEILEITKAKDEESVDRIKYKICKNLKSNYELPKIKDKLIKELAESISHPDSMAAARKFVNGGMREKIEIIEEFKENKRIAEMVKDDPKKLAVLEAIKDNPDLTNKILDLIAEQNQQLTLQQGSEPVEPDR